MISSEQQRLETLYDQHVRALKLQGYSASTIDVYARAVRRLAAYFDCVPDALSTEQLAEYFSELIESHSWGTVRVDRNGLQFFYKHVLGRDWQWVAMIKPPRVRTLPDVLTVAEVEGLIGAARKLRYRVFVLATYSMGLRLSETLALQCQNFEVTRWLERQREKLLPVDYFLVTFTLPAQLRPLAWRHQRKAYGALFAAAIATLKTFGLESKHLGADMGMTAVLHTHSRRLTYHPHLHVVVPGGGVDAKHGIWKRTRYRYLFNEIALAKVFRAKLLTAIAKAGLRIPPAVPKDWVVDCRHAGRGESALEYLSRYLYRGVIGESNILGDSAGRVSFRYSDGQTGHICIETLPGEVFLWRIVQHVLPRGFHRIRDYGFLHHNARKTLQLIQLILQVALNAVAPEERPRFCCCACGGAMEIIAFYPPGRVPAVSTCAQGPPGAIAA